MSAKPLKQAEIATVMAVYHACKGDIHAHQPVQLIRKKFVKDLRDAAKRLLEETARRPERYILKHKNKDTTYSITLNGIRVLEDMNLIPRMR